MRALELDFVAPPRHAAGRIVLAIGLALVLLLAWGGWQTARSHAAAQDKLSALKASLARREPPPAAPPDSAQLAALRDAEAVRHALEVPWDRLFAAIEELPSEQVAVLAIDPDPLQGKLQLLAEARDRATMLDYVRAIDSSGMLHHALLADANIQQKDRDKPVRFTVQAEWETRP